MAKFVRINYVSDGINVSNMPKNDIINVDNGFLNYEVSSTIPTKFNHNFLGWEMTVDNDKYKYNPYDIIKYSFDFYTYTYPFVYDDSFKNEYIDFYLSATWEKKEEFLEYIYDSDCEKKLHIIVDGVDIIKYVTSYKKIGQYMTDSVFCLGNSPSISVELELLNKDGYVNDLLNNEFYIYEEINYVKNGIDFHDEIPIGYFYVYEKPEKYTEKMSITLNDRMRSLGIAYDSKLDYPTTIIEQLNEMATISGLSYESFPKSLVDTLNFKVGFYDNSYTIRQYLSWIAEKASCNVQVNRKGLIEFRKIGVNEARMPDRIIPYRILGDITDEKDIYTISEVLFEDGLNQWISGVKQEGKYTLNISSENQYIVENDINVIGNSMIGLTLNSLSSMKLRGDPSIDLGDIISFIDEENNQLYKFMVLNIEETQNVSVIIQNLDGKIETETKSRVVDTVGINRRLRSIKVNIDRANSSLQILANQVEGVTEDVNQIYIDIDKLTFSVARQIIGARNLCLDTAFEKNINNSDTIKTAYYELSDYFIDNFPDVGSEITLSFDWQTSSKEGSFKVSWNGGTYDFFNDEEIIINEENKSGKYSKTITFTQEMYDGKMTELGVILLGVNGSFTIKHFMLEKGNKATDWQPAPEDSETYTNEQIANVNAKLEMYVDKDKLISYINASADVIQLNSNRLIVNSDKFKVAEDGTITATDGIFNGTIYGSKIIFGTMANQQQIMETIYSNGIPKGMQISGNGFLKFYQKNDKIDISNYKNDVLTNGILLNSSDVAPATHIYNNSTNGKIANALYLLSTEGENKTTLSNSNEYGSLTNEIAFYSSDSYARSYFSNFIYGFKNTKSANSIALINDDNSSFISFYNNNTNIEDKANVYPIEANSISLSCNYNSDINYIRITNKFFNLSNTASEISLEATNEYSELSFINNNSTSKKISNKIILYDGEYKEITIFNSNDTSYLNTIFLSNKNNNNSLSLTNYYNNGDLCNRIIMNEVDGLTISNSGIGNNLQGYLNFTIDANANISIQNSMNIISQHYRVYLRAAENIQCTNVGGGSYKPILASAFTVSSSLKYKENVNKFDDFDSNIIYKLKPVSFDYKEDSMMNGYYHQLGLIAEDTFINYPQCVVLDKDGKPDGIDYSKLSVLSIKAIQDHKKEIDKLNKRIEELENIIYNNIN